MFILLLVVTNREITMSSTNDPLFTNELASVSAGSQEITTISELIDSLRLAKKSSALLFVDVAWLGCSGCANTDVGSAIQQALLKYPDVLFRSLPWRDTSSYKSLVQPPFTVFMEIVRGHFQRFGEQRLVEAYSCRPPWARPHFPQFFFIDGRKVAADRVDTIEHLDSNNELFNKNGELLLYLKKDFYSSKPNDELRNALTGTLFHGGVLLQLLNEHLFGLSNLAFQRTAFDETFECVVNQFQSNPAEPKSCFRYERTQRE